MTGGNVSLAALFRELVELATLDEGEAASFRVRAYERAMEAIASHPGELARLSEKELTAIAGIGSSSAKKIREYFEKGTIAKLEELRARYPPAFVELASVPGLGPRTLARLRRELGIESLDALRAALAAHRLREVRGLGEKTEQKLLAALERRGASGEAKRWPIAIAMPIGHELVAALAALPGVERALLCGGLRRLRETVAHVELVASSRDPGPVREAFVRLPAVREVPGAGGTGSSLRAVNGLPVELRVVPDGTFGAACQHFTGSTAHNDRLRQRALARGLRLDEHGLSRLDGGGRVAGESEQEIYAALGLPWIPPPMREDKGEIELAESGTLPGEIRVEDVRGDLHVHTSLSGDGRSGLEEVLQAAAERGLDYLAITDHAEDLAMNGVGRRQLEVQRARIDAQRARFPDLLVLHGAELNIGRDGGLDYDAEFRRTLEWRVAGVHSHFELDREQQTRRVLRAMEDPTVDAIAHLSGRRIGHRAGIELDVDAVLRQAARTGTAIEINAALGRLDATSEVLWRARGLDVTFVISTDSHHVRELERLQWGVLQAMRGLVDKSRIANLWPRERFVQWLQARHA